MSDRICANCVHCAVSAGVHYCKRTQSVDVVTGRPVARECRRERAPLSGHRALWLTRALDTYQCGPTGRFFEAKSKPEAKP